MSSGPSRTLQALRSTSSVSATQARDSLVPTDEADDNVTTILRVLEAEHRLFNIPIITFLVFLAGFGISGNVCVLHVYRTRYRKTAGSFFIMALAVLDLTSASLCVPFDIFDLSYPYTLPAPVACRIFRFLEYCTTVAAGLTLTCVAFSRYFKIVNPLHCYSAGQARSLVIVMVSTALAVCWPQLVLSGTRTVRTRVAGVLGEDCSIADRYSGTVYPLLFHSVLLAVFFLCFSIMVAFYARIVCVVWKRSRTRIGERVPGASRRRRRRRQSGEEGDEEAPGRRSGTRTTSRRRSSEEPQSPGSTGSEGSLSSSQLSIISTVSMQGGGPPLANNTRGKKRGDRRGLRRRQGVHGQPASYLGRTTRMLGLVTVVALLGYVPFLTVQVVSLAGAGFQAAAMAGYEEELAFQFCLKSHYLSSAANPLIYSVLSPAFRKESMVALKHFLTSLLRNCRLK
ncbi:orexin receptor type 2-like [Babylonia areolata]|uniref:orexin receptor type 2-like n=1 Tax=Babylonia areolata TaxID=304850 RepID=UPI003FCF413C